jgi:hypothetical protein
MAALHEKLVEPARSEHFLVLGDSFGAARFAKKLEGHYQRVREILPFEELPQHQLLPVLLFRSKDEFHDFCRAVLKGGEKNDVTWRRSLVRDGYYATSGDNDDEIDQARDVAKLLLEQRLCLWGGCLWLRSGLREYIANPKGKFAEALKAVKRKNHTPLSRLLAWDQGDESTVPGEAEDEADFWQQSALWIAFLRESPAHEKRFQGFVQRAGVLRTPNAARVEALLRELYGAELDQLEREWVEYCRKR